MPSRPGSTSASAASRCTTGRSSAPRRGNGSRSRFPGSSAATSTAATRSWPPANTGPSYRLDVVLEELEEIPAGAHVQVHHGTAAAPARVVRAGERYAQLRLAVPVVAARGDRVVIRSGGTIGGGVVLDPQPPRRLDPERLARIERGDVAATVFAPVREDSLRHLLDGREPEGVERAGGWLYSAAWLEELRDDLRRRIAEADALDPGVPPPSEPWADAIVPLLGLERRGAKLYLPGASAGLGDRAAEAAELEARLGADPVKVDDRRLAAYLEQQGLLVQVGDGYAISAAAYAEAKRLLLEECAAAGSITLARFRDLTGSGRRNAQLLLERFDADGLTRRVGDASVLRRAATA